MERLFVISVDLDWYSRELMRLLKYYVAEVAMQKAKPLRMCVGAYKGQKEISFIVHEKDYLEHIEGTSFVSSQESVLLVDEANVAWLVYKDRSLCLGEWKVTAEEPEGDYTYDLGNEVYYQAQA